jgi:hypothetical protein
MLIVKQKLAVILSLLICMWVAGCGSRSNAPGPIAGEVYVIVPTEKASLFTDHLVILAKRYGMTPNLGQATDDKGYSIHVLDAASPFVRLVSQNLLLSGREDPKLCGVYTEPHSDPGQYSISVSPSTQTTDPRYSRELLVKIIDDLKMDGYDVRQKPMVCSSQSKAESKG